MRLERWAVVTTALVCALAGLFFGNTYVPRLPNHAGYFLVAVDDEVRAPPPPRPRHTVFILVDGLRRDAAETMSITGRLSAHGQCRISDQGAYTVSRPEYALLSTGLEVDRTGVRNNELTTPIPAQSIWQIARSHGLHVIGSSHLPWFGQLFPDGFDRFHAAVLHATDVFAAPELTDVNLFHPLYVDEAGHQHGASSPEYAAAVARADGEIARLLDRLDLDRDLVILTADHGHRAQGGHGGSQPGIRDVLLCFAGPDVARTTERRPFDGRSTGPAMAFLLGLPFPRHMRAGDDGLDAIFELPRAGAFSAEYIDDRRAAVTRFREQNRRVLEQWLGGSPGTWPRFYAREANARLPRLALVFAAAAALVIAYAGALRRAFGTRAALVSTAWIASAPLMLWLAHHAILGDLDYTVVNVKGRFIVRAFAAAFAAAVAGIAAHRLVIGRIDRLVRDMLVVVMLLLVADAGHVLVYGWPIGFPVPSPAARYYPFFGSIALAGYALVVIGLALAPAPGRARLRAIFTSNRRTRS